LRQRKRFIPIFKAEDIPVEAEPTEFSQQMLVLRAYLKQQYRDSPRYFDQTPIMMYDTEQKTFISWGTYWQVFNELAMDYEDQVEQRYRAVWALSQLKQLPADVIRHIVAFVDK